MEEMSRTGLTILRDALGMSLQEFAAELNVSRGTLWKWEKELPARVNRKICIQFGLNPDLDLQKELTEEQEEDVYRKAWEYLMNARKDYTKTSAGKDTSFRAGVINSKEYALVIDQTLAEVRDAFFSRKMSEDACIRIMVDALNLRMDDWLEARRRHHP